MMENNTSLVTNISSTTNVAPANNIVPATSKRTTTSKEANIVEQLTRIIEMVMLRSGGQIVKSVETIIESKTNNDQIFDLLKQSVNNDTDLIKEISLLKENLVKYNSTINQFLEHFINNASANSTSVTKEQLNQAINFLITKIPAKELAALNSQANQISSSLATFLQTNQNNKIANQETLEQHQHLNKNLQLIANQLSSLQKQQQAQQTQLEKILSHLPTGSNNLSNTSNNLQKTQPNAPKSLDEKYYSIPKTNYQISAKTLKTIGFVAICIIALIAMFK